MSLFVRITIVHTSRLAEFVPASAEIILVSVNDHGTTDDRVGPRQADETVRDLVAEEGGNSFNESLL